MFSSPYPPSPLWALHQLVTLYAFHMLMAPQCTFQPGPCPELQARTSNCLFTPLLLPPWLPAFLSSSLTPSSLSFFLPQITYYLCNLFTQAHVCVCVKQPYKEEQFTIESNSTLYRKALPKPSLKCCTHQGPAEKDFDLQAHFFYASMQPLKTWSISVSSSVQFNHYFPKFLLRAGRCAWHCRGTEMNKIYIPSETGTANSLTEKAFKKNLPGELMPQEI